MGGGRIKINKVKGLQTTKVKEDNRLGKSGDSSHGKIIKKRIKELVIKNG